MTREDAARILKCAVGASAEDVRKAYAVAVKYNHPDSHPLDSIYATQRLLHGDPPTPKLWPIQALKDARDKLLTAAGEVRHATCTVCRGSGWYTVGFKRERCPRGC